MNNNNKKRVLRSPLLLKPEVKLLTLQQKGYDPLFPVLHEASFKQ